MNLDRQILSCREAYAVFEQLANRTDDALYQALSVVHALRFQMRDDNALQTEFVGLLQDHAGRKSANETLFLVKYAFFPHTLQPGPGHKSDITKASRYAKLINRALAQNIAPADFVAFARQHGIQRTAVGSPMGKRSPRRVGPPRQKFVSDASPVVDDEALISAILQPLEPWFYTAGLATQFSELLSEASRGPQKLSLTVYVNHERAVVTGLIGRAWRGQFPEGKIRITGAASVQQPEVAVRPAPVKPKTAIGGSRLPPHRLWPTRTSLIRHGRRRDADGDVWSNWRPPR